MATNKNITMRQFNGTDYDTLYPKTLGSQIASTVPVSAGGTGITSNPSLQVNLGSGSAASVFQSAPRPGVYGTLPVSHGGTGQTSLAALASAMGAAKIQTGSYVGTGTYGASNPNSLTFSFQPKYVYLSKVAFGSEYSTEYAYADFVIITGSTMSFTNSDGSGNVYGHTYLSLLSNTFSCYFAPETGQSESSYSVFQYNMQNKIYVFCAIG